MQCNVHCFNTHIPGWQNMNKNTAGRQPRDGFEWLTQIFFFYIKNNISLLKGLVQWSLQKQCSVLDGRLCPEDYLQLLIFLCNGEQMTPCSSLKGFLPFQVGTVAVMLPSNH